jgi:HD-like signal output (HDOD) protein
MEIIHADKTTADHTMAQLWSNVRKRGDLPGFSKVVNNIVAAMRGDDDNEFNMTRTVLSDPALTQRVLRLANSAMYSVFGQDINTVSKAVIVLGTEAIGHLALGLKLIESLSGAANESDSTRNEMERAVLSGHIARQVVSSAGSRDTEEAVVCAVLHGIGRMMIAFYLPELWREIQERSAEAGAREELVAQEVLGLGLDEVGRHAAKRWGLPMSLTNTLRDMPAQAVSAPLDHAEWLAAVATLSSRCAEAARGDSSTAEEKLSALAEDYADMLGVEAEQVLQAVAAAQKMQANEESDDAASLHPESERRDVQPNQGGKPADAITILTRGVTDIRGAMKSASAGQLLTMALETVYQGLGFSRAIVFLHDREKAQYRARMCFGGGVQELLSRLTFGDAYQPDVFHAALANDKIVFIENAQEPSFMSKVPRWWKTSLPTVRSFMIMPLVVSRQPIGFIYGDWDLASPEGWIDAHEIAQLNELRLLVVQEVEQRRQIEPAWARRIL